MENNTQNKVSQGFSFYMEKDAELAEVERKKIEYLEERMDYKQPEKILQIYLKAIHDRVFKTPVGFIYLKRMQEYLLNRPEIPAEQIIPIPLYQTFGGDMREAHNPARSRIKPSQKKKEKVSPLSVSVTLNIMLAVTIIIMFVITLKADQPNILNYEKTITDRYASWEQELTEREQIIREKERELKIETE